MISPDESNDNPQIPKPYHSKRPHRKSRTGCRTCKARKVKCDEGRPSCRNCTLRRTICVYTKAPPTPPTSSPSQTSPTPSVAAGTSRSESPTTLPHDNGVLPLALSVPQSPQFRPNAFDNEDMKLLWWYSTFAFSSFSIGSPGQPSSVSRILQVNIPQLALQNRFLMDIVLSLSACHMQTTNQDISPSRAAAYRARALEGYRRAVTEMKPESRPGILAGSLLLTAVASQSFREEDTKELYILDWITVWRGIGIFLQMSAGDKASHGGVRDVFFRPVLDLAVAANYIPHELTELIASIPEDDDEYPLIEYHELTLKFLGALYAELLNGLTPITILLITTWVTYLPQPTVIAMRAKKPRALILLAHYLAFVKLLRIWWLEGITDREIPGIVRAVGPEWADAEALRVPRLATKLTDKLELARLLLNDPEWEFPPVSMEAVHRDGEIFGYPSLMSMKSLPLPQRPRVALPENDCADEFADCPPL